MLTTSHLTDTPIFSQLQAETLASKIHQQTQIALAEPLPHREPNLLRLNHRINGRRGL